MRKLPHRAGEGGGASEDTGGSGGAQPPVASINGKVGLPEGSEMGSERKTEVRNDS